MKKIIGGFTVPQLIILNTLFLALVLGYALPKWFHWRNEKVFEQFKKDSIRWAREQAEKYAEPIYHDSTTVAAYIDSQRVLHHMNPVPDSNQPVPINTATFEALQQIPGIGPALARRIMEFRRIHGPFLKTTDLLKVKGIGPRKLERMKGKIIIQAKGQK